MNLNVLCLTVWLQFLWELGYAAVYSDTWAVHIEGGETISQAIAEKHGFTYLGKVSFGDTCLRGSH